MSDERNFQTDQEAFWAGDFGDDYIGRNQGAELLAKNLDFFTDALRRAGPVSSCIEFGANIGMNLQALRLLTPKGELSAVEINSAAASELRTFLDADNVHEASILEWEPAGTYELALIKGVMIHLNPDHLQSVYEKLYKASSRFILVAEYYNPSPVAIPYRGHEDRLFKRDFAGELMDKYPDLKLIDYGFKYRRDPHFPQDDITWFLMEKMA